MEARVAGHPETPGSAQWSPRATPDGSECCRRSHSIDVSLTDPSTGRSIKCSEDRHEGSDGTGRSDRQSSQVTRCRARVRVFDPGRCERTRGVISNSAVEPVLIIAHASLIDVTRTRDGNPENRNLISLHDAWAMVVSECHLISSIGWLGDESEHDLIRAIVLGDQHECVSSRCRNPTSERERPIISP